MKKIALLVAVLLKGITASASFITTLEVTLPVAPTFTFAVTTPTAIPSGTLFTFDPGNSSATCVLSNGDPCMDIQFFQIYPTVILIQYAHSYIDEFVANLSTPGVYPIGWENIINAHQGWATLTIVDTNVVPEPSTCCLTLFALVVCCWIRRARSSAPAHKPPYEIESGANQQISGDSEANTWTIEPYRAPWRLT